MSFADDIKKFAEKSNNTVDEVIIHFVLDLAEKVIVGQPPLLGTPVDTGWAINNWVASIGEPTLAVPNEADRSGSASMQGVAFASLTAPGNIFYLTNSVAYINKLEYGGFPNPPKKGNNLTIGGYSHKAPKGFVRIGVMAAKKQLMRSTRRGYGSVR